MGSLTQMLTFRTLTKTSSPYLRRKFFLVSFVNDRNTVSGERLPRLFVLQLFLKAGGNFRSSLRYFIPVRLQNEG